MIQKSSSKYVLMSEENTTQKRRLKNIDEKRNYLIEK